MKDKDFKKCCALEIQRLWNLNGGPMNIVRYEGKCPVCGHYIGLTQTSTEEAAKFLEGFGLLPVAVDSFIKLDNGTEYRVFVDPKTKQ